MSFDAGLALPIAKRLARIRRFPRGLQAQLAIFEECARILADECETPAQASQISARYDPARWDSVAAFRLHVERSLRPEELPPQPALTVDDSGIPPDEFAALERIRNAYSGAALNPPEIFTLHEEAWNHAESAVYALPAADRSALVALAKSDFLDYLAAIRFHAPKSHPTEGQGLEINAHDIAVARMYRHQLLDRPLMEPWPALRTGKTNPRPPAGRKEIPA